MRILTKDSAGRPNGYLQTIWNALEQPELRPEQVYVTSIFPGEKKGAHLHMVRRGVFAVISGVVLFRVRDASGIYIQTVRRAGDAVLVVPPGTPMAMYNNGDVEALVLNMPSPAWSKQNPDDWPVDDWQDL